MHSKRDATFDSYDRMYDRGIVMISCWRDRRGGTDMLYLCIYRLLEVHVYGGRNINRQVFKYKVKDEPDGLQEFLNVTAVQRQTCFRDVVWRYLTRNFAGVSIKLVIHHIFEVIITSLDNFISLWYQNWKFLFFLFVKHCFNDTV